MSKFQEEYKRANKAQKQAINTIEGPVMVVAGPGTGKTQTLALRIANILKVTQTNPENILCLTFTDTASVNMLDRLEEFIGPSAYKVKIYTFHSFCKYLIQSNLEKFPLLMDADQNIDDLEKVQLIREIVEKLPSENVLRNIRFQEVNLKRIGDKIRDLKREGVSPEDFAKIIFDEKDYYKKTNKIYTAFTSIHARKLNDEDVTEFIKAITKASPESVYTRGVLELVKDLDDNKAIRDAVKKLYSRFANDSYFPKLEALNQVYKEYQERLKDLGKYDYEDMIMMVLDRLKLDEAFLADIREEFQYILVDEYQDTNSAQNQIVEIIGSYFDNPNIFVVGDDDQSIFRFQGASLENILHFSKLYGEDIQFVTLRENYRSTKAVLDVSRKVIEEVSNRLEDEFEEVNKELLVNVKSKGNIEYFEADNETEEAIEIANRIKSISKDETVGVILTKNAQVDNYIEVFHKKKIAFNSKNSIDPLDDENVANLVTIMRFLIEIERMDYLQQILYMPYFELDSFDVFRATNYAYEKRISLFRVISSKELIKDGEIENEKLLDVAKLLSEMHGLVSTKKAVNVFPELLVKTNILNKLVNIDSKFDSLSRINALYAYIKQNQRNNFDYKISDFIESIDLSKYFNLQLFREDGFDNDSNVTISTVHSAKGLEFDHVFIPSVVDKNWEKARGQAEIVKLPASINKQDYSSQDIDEKIRLFYVAVTRAKKNITFSMPELDEKGKQMRPSMFLSLLDFKTKKTEASKLDTNSLEEILKPTSKFSKKGKEYLSEKMKKYVISPTHFNSYRVCPHCFFLTKVAYMPFMITPSSAYGNAIHLSLNKFLAKYRRTKNLPELDFLLNTFEVEIKKQFFESDYEDFLKEGLSALEQFYNQKLDDLSSTSLPELNFSNYDVRVDEIPVKGMIDRIDFLDGGSSNIQVVDYKTGKFRSDKVSKSGKGDYYVQLLFYKLLIENTPKFNWKVKNSKIVYVEPDSSGNVQVDKSFELPESDIDWLKKELTKVYNSIINLEFSEKGVKCYTPELHNIHFEF